MTLLNLFNIQELLAKQFFKYFLIIETTIEALEIKNSKEQMRGENELLPTVQLASALQMRGGREEKEEREIMNSVIVYVRLYAWSDFQVTIPNTFHCYMHFSFFGREVVHRHA